jgi:CRP-like cAMP-binding protein
MRSDIERTLTEVPLFRRLGRAYLLDIAQHAKLQTFAPGEAIVREGDQSDEFFVIVEGAADVVKEREGSSKALVSLRDGECFGELSLFDGKPRSATVRATAHTTCLVIPRQEILETVEASPEVALRLLEYLSTRLSETTDAIVRG